MTDYDSLQSEGLEVAENFQSSEWLRLQTNNGEIDTVVKIIGLEITYAGVEVIELRADLIDAIKFSEHSSNYSVFGFKFLNLKNQNYHFQHLINKTFCFKKVKMYDIDYKQNMTTMCLSL